ncbi:MAG: hypothetical protein F9K25_20090 [Candidatus Contendobacter sp.]|nr:MAG: hypothetical protein F9K25_20090 [Candidatus Contendobacter sp.]
MGDFNRRIKIILKEEGGLSNHRRDPGGLTKFGISQRSYPNLDIASLTREQAIEIYHADYWNPIKGDDLPAGLDLLLLDTAVNMGVITAALLLQDALGVTLDGHIGPITLGRARQNMPEILGDYCAVRAWRYEINRNEDTFGKGWFRRLFRTYETARSWSQK